jgi:hypothetical protein
MPTSCESAPRRSSRPPWPARSDENSGNAGCERPCLPEAATVASPIREPSPTAPCRADINAQLSRRLIAAGPSKAFFGATEDLIGKGLVSPSLGFEGHLQNERDSGLCSARSRRPFARPQCAQGDRCSRAPGKTLRVWSRLRASAALVEWTPPTPFLIRRGGASVATIARSPAIVRRFLTSRTIPLSPWAKVRMI